MKRRNDAGEYRRSKERALQADMGLRQVRTSPLHRATGEGGVAGSMAWSTSGTVCVVNGGTHNEVKHDEKSVQPSTVQQVGPLGLKTTTTPPPSLTLFEHHRSSSSFLFLEALLTLDTEKPLCSIVV